MFINDSILLALHSSTVEVMKMLPLSLFVVYKQAIECERSRTVCLLSPLIVFQFFFIHSSVFVMLYAPGLLLIFMTSLHSLPFSFQHNPQHHHYGNAHRNWKKSGKEWMGFSFILIHFAYFPLVFLLALFFLLLYADCLTRRIITKMTFHFPSSPLTSI